VIAFADDVQYPDDSCYSQGLALATSANKEKLTDFAVRIHPSLQSHANYSKAFNEAFRLLATSDTNNSDSVMSNSRRGMKVSSLASDSPDVSRCIVVDMSVRYLNSPRHSPQLANR